VFIRDEIQKAYLEFLFLDYGRKPVDPFFYVAYADPWIREDSDYKGMFRTQGQLLNRGAADQGAFEDGGSLARAFAKTPAPTFRPPTGRFSSLTCARGALPTARVYRKHLGPNMEKLRGG